MSRLKKYFCSYAFSILCNEVSWCCTDSPNINSNIEICGTYLNKRI